MPLGRRTKRATLLLGGVVLALALTEAALRVAGFEFHLRPEDVEFGGPTPEERRKHFDADPDLLWVRRGYADDLARLRRERPRICFLGDSCTQLGVWEDVFAELWSRRNGGRKLPFANLGVIGWSSWQGRLQFERDVAPLAPRVVTLWWGWNDHWTGFGIEDAQVSALPKATSPVVDALRLGQLVTRLRVGAEIGDDPRPRRVPEPAFRENLTAIVRSAKARDIVPVLLTGPTTHVPGRTPEMFRSRWLKEGDDLATLHARYAGIVREVARAEQAPLVDLARAFDAMPPSARAPLFMEDGIHFTRRGNERIGELLFEAFDGLALLERLRD